MNSDHSISSIVCNLQMVFHIRYFVFQILNLPDVSDINQLIDAIANIGATVNRIDRHTVTINGKTIRTHVVEYEQMRKIRASYYLLGALLGKFNKAEVALPVLL